MRVACHRLKSTSPAFPCDNKNPAGAGFLFTAAAVTNLHVHAAHAAHTAHAAAHAAHAASGTFVLWQLRH